MVNSDRRKVLTNGSLLLEAVIGTDAANYSCKAENDYGSDVITYSLSVQGMFDKLDIMMMINAIFLSKA